MKKKKPLLILLFAILGIIAALVLFLIISSALGVGNLSVELPIEKTEYFLPDSGGYPAALHVKDNLIYDACGEQVILKGVMVPDLKRLRNKKEFSEEYFDDVFALGGNVIRIPIHPEYYVSDEYYLWRNVDPVVEWAGENDFYVIIDWHCIGNPLTGKGENLSDIEDDVMGVSCDFWQQTSRHYKGVSNVIFEIYNEPTDIDKEDWEEVAGTLIDAIRAENEDALIIVGSPSNSHDLAWVRNNTITDSNVAFSAHFFPIHTNWKRMLDAVSEKYPVLVTEWGFSDSDVSLSQPYLFGSESSYGRPLADYMEEKQIGWTAAWWDDSWEPVMISKETGELTKWGEFFVSLLK